MIFFSCFYIFNLIPTQRFNLCDIDTALHQTHILSYQIYEKDIQREKSGTENTTVKLAIYNLIFYVPKLYQESFFFFLIKIKITIKKKPN